MHDNFDRPLFHPGRRQLRPAGSTGCQHVRLSRLTPHIGAQIEGVDLTEPLAEEAGWEIRQEPLERKVILFHDLHRLTPGGREALTTSRRDA